MCLKNSHPSPLGAAIQSSGVSVLLSGCMGAMSLRPSIRMVGWVVEKPSGTP